MNPQGKLAFDTLCQMKPEHARRVIAAKKIHHEPISPMDELVTYFSKDGVG